MCGIAGYHWFASEAPSDAKEIVERMIGTLHYRGPDSDGVIDAPSVRVRFKRLAIVDLETGEQPVGNETGSVRAFLNGEIYNHHDLRRELEQSGHQFQANGDAEVIPHLFEEHGEEFLHHLNGMFAICLCDVRSGKMLLARDRFGIKPLYYAQTSRGLVFASEMKAILASGLVERTMDEASLLSHLNFFYCPGRHTLVEGVCKLMPGEMLEADAFGNIRIRNWYRLDPERDNDDGAPDLERLNGLLKDSVRLRMEADVPVGVALSGGLDSSLIAMEAARACGPRVTAFTALCDQSPREELECARAVAERFDMQHVVVPTHTDDFMNEAARMVWHADEPITDPAFYPGQKLSEEAAEVVKVLLLGAGADELFAGYGHYQHSARQRWGSRIPRRWVQAMASRVAKRNPRFAERIRAVNSLRSSRFPLHALAMSNLSGWERAQLVGHCPGSRDPLADLCGCFAEGCEADPLNQQLFADIYTYQAGQVLPMLDRTTMSASIEGRVPFLDHRVAEEAFRIQGKYKLGGRNEAKHLLKRLGAGALPERVLRRAKSGFPSPVFHWLTGELAPILNRVIEGDDFLVGRFLPREWVRDMAATPERVRKNAAPLYSLLMLSVWHELFIVRGISETPDISLVDLFAVPRQRAGYRRAA